MHANVDEMDQESPPDVWPALTDLLAASAMLFLVLLSVVVYDRLRQADQEHILRQELVAALKAVPNRKRLFSIGDDPQLVRITLQEDVTFPSGKYMYTDLKPQGRTALAQIGRILQQEPINHLYQQVLVLGHTDQVPIRASQITNWELSAMRAAAVVRYLVHYVDVDPCRISASGAGPYYPLIAPNGIYNHRENRRIEIVILPARAGQAEAGVACDPEGDRTLGAERAMAAADTSGAAPFDTSASSASDTSISAASDTALRAPGEARPEEASAP